MLSCKSVYIPKIFQMSALNNNNNNNNNSTFVERHSAVASEALAEQVS